jgi:hypothetical protein
MIDSSYQKSNPHQYPNERILPVDNQDDRSNNEHDMSAPPNPRKMQNIRI